MNMIDKEEDWVKSTEPTSWHHSLNRKNKTL